MKSKINELLNQEDAYTLVSYIDEKGYPVCKAMLKPRYVEDSKYFYFSTNTSSNKITSVKKHGKGSIYLFNPYTFCGISLVGKAEVLRDQEIREKIWADGDEVFYPLGVNDPDYCVLKFTITHGRAYLTNKHVDFTI